MTPYYPLCDRYRYLADCCTKWVSVDAYVGLAADRGKCIASVDTSSLTDPRVLDPVPAGCAVFVLIFCFLRSVALKGHSLLH